jgi:hypothetical protein
MSPMQQIFLGLGAVAKKSYVDDLFSTYVYEGNNSTLAINNGLDLATEGGMIWVKNRDRARDNCIVDTERGIGKRLETNKADAQDVYVTTKNISSFTSTGFTLGVDEGHDEFNRNEDDYASWSFRKAPGFFDVVTWTGNGTARTIAHSLKSVPGCILIKCTSAGFNWRVYHRGANGGVNPEDYGLSLNTTAAEADNATYFNDTLPTSTHFTIGTNATVNSNGSTYVAYVFAGGESTAATAKSVKFNGSSQSLHMAASTSSMDFASSGKFTIEFFVKLDSLTNGSTSANYQTMVGRWNGSTGFSWLIDTNKGDGDINLYLGDGTSNYYASIDAPNGTISAGQWYHIAVVKNGTTGTIFVDGIPKASSSSWTQGSTNNSTIVQVANNNASFGSALDGQISNFRVTNGQALYTAAFKPPTEPLTTTSQGATASNVKILMCQDTNPTVGAVTTGTITNNGSATASTDSPFDDPAGFVFGDAEDQNVIKCGSYVGNATANHEIHLGWEPQWWLVKNADATQNWQLLDSMRGWVNDGNDDYLAPNNDSAESGFNFGNPTATGFNLSNASSNWQNEDGVTYVYMAIRRSDGYVGKPPELGTGVFNVALGAGNASIPEFTANFAVDLGIVRQFANIQNNYVASRLTGTKYVQTNDTAAESSAATFVFDSNAGWNSNSNNTNISWMWKRHAGFDVVTYTGNQVSRTVNHSLNAVPEMIWSRDRTDSGDWIVYHKGLNAGTSGETPAHKFLYLNKTDAEAGWVVPWNDTEPTSVGFPVQASTTFNKTGNNYLTMLFASVDGISKVDGYDGDTNAQDKTISCGFQPRFVIAKCSTVGGSYNHWFVFDSTRGAGSGNDKTLRLDVDEAQTTNQDIIEFTSNGFIVKAGYQLNEGSRKYIYYAHS